MHNGRKKVKVLQSAFFVCWEILIDHKAIDQSHPQNPIENSISITSGYELYIKIGSILVTHIHTHLVLVVGINHDWYIKLFLALSREKCGICSTCIGTLVAWMLSHSQQQWILITKRVNYRHYGKRRTVHPYQGCNPIINSSTSKIIGQFGIFPNFELLEKSLELLSANTTCYYSNSMELCQPRS